MIGDIAYCTLQWSHSILEEVNFLSPWQACERAVDQHISVCGFDVCSQLLDGSKCHYDHIAFPAVLPGRHVSFSNHIELLLESEEGKISEVVLTHNQLESWYDKPWSLRPDCKAVVEPLSSLAVLIPTCYEAVSHSPFVTTSSSAHEESSPHVGRGVPPSATATLPVHLDHAIYDMNNVWLMQLRIDWREHATVEHTDEGRILYVKTWYIHHHEARRCAQPRIVKLDYMDHLWLDDIREAWNDRLRAGEIMHITSVMPTPPQPDDQTFMPHLIISQGSVPERVGTIMTARFIEEHRTQLLQEAISTPSWMCGSRAVDLLQIAHLVHGRQWIARSGILMFSVDELEPIADGLSINVDIRVPPPDDDDVTSLAAWTRRNYPPDQPLFELPRAVQQHPPDDVIPQEEGSPRSSSDDDEQRGQDWRFTHVYRTRRRVYHGHLPWDDAFTFHHRVAQMTNVAEDDIVYCHHVEHRPHDLKAAHTEALLLHSAGDLPLGSFHRLVLVDLEFHEQAPATDASTSRRCISLPHQVHRRTILRLLGIDIFCARMRARCLMWKNHELIELQRPGTFFLEHGDYLRIAIPPSDRQQLSVSTRTCVSTSKLSRSQRQSRRHRQTRSPMHEEGTTDVDNYERGLYPHRTEVHESDDQMNLMQSVLWSHIHLPVAPANLLASEAAQACTWTCRSRVHTMNDENTAHHADEPPLAHHSEVSSHISSPQLNAQSTFIQDLHAAILGGKRVMLDEKANFYVDVWFSDHLRRPHSGMGRLALLSADFSTWKAALVTTWSDHIDPLCEITCHLVLPPPEGSDPEAAATVLLVQNEQPDQSTVLVTCHANAVTRPSALLMCFTISHRDPHSGLSALIDVENACSSSTDGAHCHTWWGDTDISHMPFVALKHAVVLQFYRTSLAPAVQNHPQEREELDDEIAWIQHRPLLKRQILLEDCIARPSPPVWVTVDCQHILFLRNQLHQMTKLVPVIPHSQVEWHPNTARELQEMTTWTTERPLGYTFYTDGSATRDRLKGAGAVVLIVTTDQGPRWGGYATAKCLGDVSAPRAEASALMLAIRWSLQLLLQLPTKHTWIEFAFDCQQVASVAQGKQGSHMNLDLLTPIRALLHWIELHICESIRWTHLASHRGHPWNEAADTLCKIAAAKGATFADLHLFQQCCTFDGIDLYSIQWLWLLEQSIRGHADAPPLVGHHWRFNIAQPLRQLPTADGHPAMLRQEVQPDGPREVAHIRLQLGTANVLTLYPGQEFASHYMSARAESLAQQFLNQDLQIIGLQETRSRLEGHTMLAQFHVLSAPATSRGVGGVQLWINKKLRDKNMTVDVASHHLHILHASSRRLVVRLVCNGLRLIFLVLHAPVEDNDTTLTNFWKTTSSTIPQQYREWKTFVLIDANSRLGSVCSEAVGDYQATVENDKGSHFHQWLIERQLFLPQTFLEYHCGEGNTWVHATGARARLDYIACPQELRGEAVSTWIDEKIDLSLQKEDHFCVRAVAPISFYTTAATRKKPRILPWTPAELPQWKTDVHTHAATLQHQLRQCQVPRKVLRKTHLTEDTVKLIEAKRHHWHCLNRVRRHRRFAMLRQIFDSWRHDRRCSQNFQPWLRQCDREEAQHLAHFRDLAPRVVTAVRQDDIDFYEGLAANAGRESLRGSRQLWSAIQPMLPRWRARQRSSLRSVGPSVEDKINHYNLLEAGEPVAYPELLQRCWQAQQQAMSDAHIEMSVQDLPTRNNIENLCARLKISKAPGLDMVLPSTLRTLGIPIAEDLTKLFVKIWNTSAEPVQFKGGLVHTIGKKQKSNKIQDMRGITLLDSMAKLSHALLRQQYIKQLAVHRAPLQLGGFAQQSTLFATQYLRACTQHASRKHLSTCMLFLDIKSAFHSMMRQMVFDPTMSIPPRLMQVLEHTGCDLSVIQRRCQQAETVPDLPQATARLLSDAHKHTWYVVASCDMVQQTHRGSRPGSPLADAAYNGLMTALIAELQTLLADQPQIQAAYQVLEMTYPIVAWIDDLAVPIITIKASQLVQVANEILQKISDICRSFGLVLNLQPKKTEAVVAFRGDDAAAQRRRWFGEHQGVLHQVDGNPILRCVPSYEHLGTMYTADGAIASELQHRMNKAKNAHHQVRKPILANKHIPSHIRLKLLEGLILPVMFHGSGNWPLLSQRQLTRLHGVYMKWIRAIVGNGCWTTDMMSDQQVLLLWRLPSIPLRLAKMRLLFAFHFIQACPAAIVEAVTASAEHSASWIPALRQALQWMRTMAPELIAWDPSHAPLSAIMDWLHAHRDDGPRLVRRLFHRALSQGYVVGKAVQHHWRLRACFLGVERIPRRHPPVADVILQHFECRLCMKTFGTLHQLQVHQWLAHEQVSDERSFMHNTTCDACHVCFWSSQRLQQHLRYSRLHEGGCYERLTWRCSPTRFVPDVERTDSSLWFHRQPAMQVATVPSQAETQLDSRAAADYVWNQRWQEEGLPSSLDEVWAEELTCCFDETLRRWQPTKPDDVDPMLFQLMELAARVHSQFPHAPLGEWALCIWIMDGLKRSRFLDIPGTYFISIDTALRTVLFESHIGQLLCWRRRMDEAHQPNAKQRAAVQGHRQDLEPIMDPCALQLQLIAPVFDEDVCFPSSLKVPLILWEGVPTILIFHLFSGRRRVGDCHWWLEQLGARLLPEYAIKMISIDTAIDRIHGDLSTGQNLTKILQLARGGAVAASMTGPPCETFSAARNIQLPDSVGPRPLRTRAPWCLPTSSDRELRQTATGTELLMNSLQVEVATVGAGGGSLMEHPAEPNGEEKVSVWTLRCQTEWCMNLRGACKHRVDQWLYGASGVKPTNLRALNLGPPEVVGRALAHGAEPWRIKPTQGLKGKGKDGEFRTAQAKEYPSALCRSLIVAILKGLRYRLHNEGSRAPFSPSKELVQWLYHMHEQSEVLALRSYLPDYQGA